jgi:hypothetical protein
MSPIVTKSVLDFLKEELKNMKHIFGETPSIKSAQEKRNICDLKVLGI